MFGDGTLRATYRLASLGYSTRLTFAGRTSARMLCIYCAAMSGVSARSALPGSAALFDENFIHVDFAETER